jgi:hypothetical protein
MSQNFRLFLASLITADGWKAPLQIPELRLLFSLLLCKTALPENNLQTFADNLRTTEDNLQTTEDNLHIPDDDNLQTPTDSQHGNTKREVKDEDGFALDEMEEKCKNNIAKASQEDHYDAEKIVNDVPGSKIASTKRQRSTESVPRRRIAEKKRRKINPSDLDRTCCSVCGKQFVGAERLAQHRASHVVERVVSSTGGSVVIRCQFERCEFEAKEDEGSSSISSISRWRAAVREHELKHSCPICRSVYPTADQIR